MMWPEAPMGERERVERRERGAEGDTAMLVIRNTDHSGAGGVAVNYCWPCGA